MQDAEELTVDEFMAKVGKVLREADFPTKSKIVRKLSQLFTDRAIPQDAISAAIYSVLTGSEGTLSPDCTYSDHQQFVQAAMPLLFTIADHDKDFLVELMFAYTEGSQATRYVFFTCAVLTINLCRIFLQKTVAYCVCTFNCTCSRHCQLCCR